MDQSTFDAHFRGIIEACEKLLVVKGNDYAGSEDRLANFKRNAEAVGLKPLQVWSVYFMKHIDAIMTYVRDGAVKSEAIEGRFQDAINYLILGSALVAEAEAFKQITGIDLASGQFVSTEPGDRVVIHELGNPDPIAFYPEPPATYDAHDDSKEPPF